MSEQTRASRVSERLVQISDELRQLSEASEPESQKYLSIEETFTRVNALYTNTIDVELIAMQSGLHTNTVRKLFKDRNAFFNAKLSTIESFLDTLGMSLWTS